MNDDTIYFAKTNFRGEEKVFGIRNRDRRQHFYIVGKSGTGKTSLIANMVLQDIENNKGIAIVDPHGDVVEEIVERIPENRAADVIYFNPVDMEYPIGFNVLEVPDARYKHLIASDLMGIFTKIWANVWSARMEYILNNCVLALIDTPGTTLLGIPRILTDQTYRHKIIENIKDPVVRSFWVNEFESWQDRFRNEAIVPIQNKVGQFLSTSLIRNIVGQPKSALNIGEIMNSGKILLVNVSKGRVGEDNANLLGAMLITKMQLAAMERVRIPENERRDFYLYVDEFQNFATESFASVLSEARKYRLNLIIAHQYIGQLVTGASTKVRDSIFGNVGTIVSFRVGAADAEFLEKEFEPEFVIQDLVNLPNFNIYLKLMVDGVTSRPFSAATLPPITVSQKTINKEKIIDESRRLYASKREDVEDQINKWSAGEEELIDEALKIGGGGEKNQVVCWACGKETEVNFKPDKGRPVYCQNCLKKIEKGEISPVKLPVFKKEREKKFEASLGKLGIEFAEDFTKPVLKSNDNAYKPIQNKFQKQFIPERKNISTREGEFVLKKSNEEIKKEISLTELRLKRVPQTKNIQKKSRELEGLKSMIKDVLSKKKEEEKINGSKEENYKKKEIKQNEIPRDEIKNKENKINSEENIKEESVHGAKEEKNTGETAKENIKENNNIVSEGGDNIVPVGGDTAAPETKKEEKEEKVLFKFKESDNIVPVGGDNIVSVDKKKEQKEDEKNDSRQKISPGDVIKFE